MNIFFDQLKNEVASIETTPKKLRNFGWLVGGIFLVWGLLVFSLVFGKIIAVLGVGLLIGSSRPALLRGAYKIWMMLGVVLGFFVSRLILVIVYFCAIFPIGFLRRVFSSHPDQKDTYWLIKEKNSNPENLY